MASITSIVQALVTAVSEDITFLKGDSAFQNFLADKVEDFPIALMDTPIKFNVTHRQSGYKEIEYSVMIMFADKTVLEAADADRRTVIDVQTGYMLDFISACERNTDVRTFSAQGGYELHDVFDVNVSGVVLEINIVPKNDRSIC